VGVEFGPLGVEIGGSVLTAYRVPARTDRKAVSDIVRPLSEHPLGLTLAAGLTTLPSFTDYRTLLAELSSTEPEWLEVAQLWDELPAGCARPFTNALLRSFDSLSQAGKDVLCAASVLAPTVIPHDLLAGMAHRVTGVDAEGVADGLERAGERGLIDQTNAVGGTMHALVARAVRVLAEPTGRRMRLGDAALAELAAVVGRTRYAYRHREVLHHLPHVRAVVGLFARRRRQLADRELRASSAERNGPDADRGRRDQECVGRLQRSRSAARNPQQLHLSDLSARYLQPSRCDPTRPRRAAWCMRTRTAPAASVCSDTVWRSPRHASVRPGTLDGRNAVERGREWLEVV